MDEQHFYISYIINANQFWNKQFVFPAVVQLSSALKKLLASVAFLVYGYDDGHTSFPLSNVCVDQV